MITTVELSLYWSIFEIFSAEFRFFIYADHVFIFLILLSPEDVFSYQTRNRSQPSQGQYPNVYGDVFWLYEAKTTQTIAFASNEDKV